MVQNLVSPSALPKALAPPQLALSFLPNGANCSPDVAWIPLEKWNDLTPEQQEKFLPLCPDFVIELRSPTDEIYRQGQTKEILDNPASLSGEDVLPGFVLDIASIW